MKKTLLLILSVCFLFAAVGCSSGTDYSSDIDRLNAQIEQLQSELNALKGENSDTDALKEQIEQLQEQITALQQENAALEENLKQTSEELTAKAEALQTELTAATARLTALEAAVNTEPVICDFGDTYTLSNNGIDLFSIKFLSFRGNDTSNPPLLSNTSLRVYKFSNALFECFQLYWGSCGIRHYKLQPN